MPVWACPLGPLFLLATAAEAARPTLTKICLLVDRLIMTRPAGGGTMIPIWGLTPLP